MKSQGLFLKALALTICPALAYPTCPDDASVCASTQQGLFYGQTADNGRQWLGIRYAAPPVGPLRFAAPEKVNTSAIVHNATQFGSPCLQAKTSYDVHRGSEDCLFLNVYAPGKSSHASELPVMIWMHGGGFVNGAGSDFVSGNLSRNADAVIVTINYRLGPFGFLALDSLSEEQGGASGNYGLMDQRLAFQWVQDNIAGFGGDPSRVTIFGQSAGGESVFAHVAAAPAGLFHRAISHSAPAALDLPSLKTASKRNQEAYATAAGCGNLTGTAQVACLRALSPEDALSHANETFNLLKYGGLYWTPIIKVPTLPDQWINIYRSGRFNKVPIMIGHTAEEGRLFTAIYENEQGSPLSEEDMDQILAKQASWLGAQVVKARYPANLYGTPANRTASIVTDGSFAAGLIRVRDALAAAKDGPPVWSFQFRDPWAYDVNVVGEFERIMDGHDSDLPFLFQYNPGQVPPHDLPTSPSEIQLTQNFGHYWGNFARTGDPNSLGLPPWAQWTNATTAATLSLQPLGGGTQALPEGSYPKSHQWQFWQPLIEALLAADNIKNA